MAQSNPFLQTPSVSAEPPGGLKPLGDINPTEPLKSLSGYNATTRGLDNPTQTVEGRVGGIVQKDSPLMQLAATSADQQMNRRGLRNSSLAVGAGQQAVLNAALPIANADALISNDVTNRNQDALNQASQFAATSRNTGALQQLQGNQQIGAIEKQGQQNLGQIAAQGDIQKQLQAQNAQLQMQLEQARGQIQKDLLTAEGSQKQALLDKQAQIDTQLQTLKGGQDYGLQQLRGNQATDLAQIESRYKLLAQTSDSASRTFAMAQQEISQILQNPDMDVAAKQSQVDRQISLLKSGLSIEGGFANVNTLSLLDFS